MSTAREGVIQAFAPGKVVLWGEYAVLAGAPALVMAVDRYARCTVDCSRTVTRTSEGAPAGWRFSSLGFAAEPVACTGAALRAATPPSSGSSAWTAWHVLATLDAGMLPESAAVTIDTTGFYRHGAKLGLGSSAAVCVALYGAFCSLLDSTPQFAEVAAIHHRLQGNRGSGIDVAAAWFGGMQCFERDPHSDRPPRVRDAGLPVGLQVAFVWAGHPAATTEHLQRFAEWRARGSTAELDALVEASRDLFAARDPIAGLRHYVSCLDRLDRAADLAIYDAAHRELHQLAADDGVVYKPCGAGGGDIGAAFSYDPQALQRFMASTRARGFAPITLETAGHGIYVRR